MQDALFKVCIFGDGGVGKTTLVQRLLTGVFTTNTGMTIGVEFHMKKFDFNGRKVTLQIWDFGGEERFRFLLPTYVNGASGGIFMFDITRQSSLANLDDWIKIFIEGSRNEFLDVPIIMVGGKLDLHDRRSVFSTDAIDLANEYNLLEYIECSSKSGTNIDVIFYKLALEITKRAGLL